MTNPDAPATANGNATTIVSTSITKDATGAPASALGDDDQRWLETVLSSLKGRSREAQQALIKALQDGHTNGAGPLLGLELSSTENKQEIQTKREDSNPSAMLSPLLAPSTHSSQFADGCKNSGNLPRIVSF